MEDITIWNVLFLVAYFLPTAVATYREHRNWWPVFLLNFLLGWTGIGWIAALIWSTSAQKPA